MLRTFTQDLAAPWHLKVRSLAGHPSDTDPRWPVLGTPQRPVAWGPDGAVRHSEACRGLRRQPRRRSGASELGAADLSRVRPATGCQGGRAALTRTGQTDFRRMLICLIAAAEIRRTPTTVCVSVCARASARVSGLGLLVWACKGWGRDGF